jgi:predicted SnoaL-like aldol condensation-catalyzing enzyme
MSIPSAQSNQLLVLRAFDALFNKRDYVAAARFWSPDYIQHSAHIGAGRAGLFELTRALPLSLRYEHAHAAADGDIVILHGRFSGHGLRKNWVVADILRLENGMLVEHWDVIQDEATKDESKSGLPMFGLSFAAPDDPLA